MPNSPSSLPTGTNFTACGGRQFGIGKRYQYGFRGAIEGALDGDAQEYFEVTNSSKLSSSARPICPIVGELPSNAWRSLFSVVNRLFT
jgi:hypothetical protein